MKTIVFGMFMVLMPMIVLAAPVNPADRQHSKIPQPDDGFYVCYELANRGCFTSHKSCRLRHRQIYNSYKSDNAMKAGNERCLIKHIHN